VYLVGVGNVFTVVGAREVLLVVREVEED